MKVTGSAAKPAGPTGPTVVTRELTSQVVGGGPSRVGAQPLDTVSTVPGGGGSEHGNGLRGELGHVGDGPTVHGKGVSNVGSPVLNGTLASDKGLNVVAEHGEHGQPSILGLLDFQLSEGVGIISQTQRVEGITRVRVVQTLQTPRGGTGMVRLGGTHQHNLASQDGKKGLSAHQVGVAKVVKTTLREDLGTSLEPHGLTELNTAVRGHQLRGQAAESSRHSPTGMDRLSLTVGGSPPERVPLGRSGLAS